MRELLKMFIPDSLLKLIRDKIRQHNRIKNSKYYNMKAKETFTEIYNGNHWDSSESSSGSGSEINQTKSLIKDLDKLITDMNFLSILDLPCGDFNWMQKVNLSKIDYIGADIVDELVMSNTRLFKEKKNIQFKTINLITDPLPKSDLIIVRDCLVHLSFKDIKKVIKNIKSSRCKYLLSTTFTNHDHNLDITTGDWRPLNLEKKPFNLSSPIITINEKCTEQNEKYKDKSLALWDITKI
jgi:hypothetical protein